MSRVDYFDNSAPINPMMDALAKVDLDKARAEHDNIKNALGQAGVKVTQVMAPVGCQDGVYSANWGLERNGVVVLARLPSARKNEEKYAKQVFESLGKQVIEIPGQYRFSGQGDALPCGDLLFCGQDYRADIEAQAFASKTLGYRRIQLKTIPLLNQYNKPVINSHSGWQDSRFYDLDLSLSVIKPPTSNSKGLIAWCPEAFTTDSQRTLRRLDEVDKIEVSLDEATRVYAMNLVSTGETVIMNQGAPHYAGELKKRGLKVVELSNTELAKGGGSIRCTSVCISNT